MGSLKKEGGLEPSYELREWGWGRGGGLRKSVKKGKFVTKIFLSDVEWSSKNLWKMISADVKANKNNKK